MKPLKLTLCKTVISPYVEHNPQPKSIKQENIKEEDLKPYSHLTQIILATVLFFTTNCASSLPHSKQSSPIGSPQASRSQTKQELTELQSSAPAMRPQSINDVATETTGQSVDADADPSGELPDNDADPVLSEEQNLETANTNDPLSKKEQPLLDEALDFCEVAQDFWQKGELENALDSLDKAYALILSVDTEADPKLIQQKEDLRYLISKRILEIYASRNIVVTGNHNAIPLEMNRHIQAELELFTTGPEREFFQNAYYRSGKYRAFILESLKNAGLPEELAWIPLIESGFKVTALSKARALGLWQFIPSTGYKFGLKRDKFIDERIDPYKATTAAIAYLKELHSIFGDWSTVLAAYNCGEGRVLRVIRTQNINYLDNFWDLYERLPRETARYVPRFIATLHISKNPQKYGLDPVKQAEPLPHEIIEVNRQIHLKDLAQTIGMPLADLKELNPELRYDILPPERYALKITPGRGEMLLAQLDTIPLSNPPQRAFVWHKVKPGENITTIARKYRTSVSNIMQANGIRRSHYIMAGKTLKIPQQGYVMANSIPTPAAKEIPIIKYRVKRGDSLWILAKRYDTTTKNIQDINKLSTTRLVIGQTLNVPEKSDANASVENSKSTYYVKSGDNATAIAKRHQMSLSRLLQLNNLTSASKIYPGQQLLID